MALIANDSTTITRSKVWVKSWEICADYRWLRFLGQGQLTPSAVTGNHRPLRLARALPMLNSLHEKDMLHQRTVLWSNDLMYRKEKWYRWNDRKSLIDMDLHSRDYTPESSIAFTWTRSSLDLLVDSSDSQTKCHGLSTEGSWRMKGSKAIIPAKLEGVSDSV